MYKKVFHNEKESIKHEAQIILNLYVFNNITSKYI